MTIKLKDLITIFPRRTDIARVLKISRQAVSMTSEFRDKKKIRKLERACKKRMDEINEAYGRIQEGIEDVETGKTG